MANRGKTLDPQVFCIKDLERLGSDRMLKTYREYYNEGAMDLITLRANESAYNRYMIRPRVLRNLSSLDTSTTIVGCKVKFPFGFSPTAMQTLAHPVGEEGTSKACAGFNTMMGLSNYSTKGLEGVIAHGQGNPYVMQMSLLKNKDAMIRLIKRAEAAGFKALFVTLDVPYLGRRLNEYRNNFGVPNGMEYPNLFPGVDVTNLEDGDDSMAYDNAVEWTDIIPFFRKHTKMEIWGKGIYTAPDAELAIKHGFDGIIISNHGGRQLDSVPSSLDALREIAPVAKGKIPIAVDGGIRRGTDIFKALALGADFCLAGRPAIWGLAYDGQRGVELALGLLYDEFKTCMALAGCKNVSEISTEHISLLQPDGRLLKL
ncbi:alpha-hydroxy acid oxidase [Aspergillus candidus]|uniref:Oxidase FUB9 n=1 Tax=Aspergillus candidus TaxID=41067 RepID=A0A2I2FID1_ASPCN|nr:FMN-dependent dehydrogenase [Aspergillus candidus]PLB40391.1 FMN-dependent dehydrogenase [Aspergillus candidus]